jgi:hypothetical protein
VHRNEIKLFKAPLLFEKIQYLRTVTKNKILLLGDYAQRCGGEKIKLKIYVLLLLLRKPEPGKSPAEAFCDTTALGKGSRMGHGGTRKIIFHIPRNPLPMKTSARRKKLIARREI